MTIGEGNGIFNFCYNDGNLISIGGRQIVGGIVGYVGVNNYSLNNCYNIGDIKLSDTDLLVNCGGLIGYVFGLRLENCHDNSKIFTENLNYVANKIGLFAGSAYGGKRC